ncbi:MAG: alpha/beta hydrolase [Bryobacter sp.]
MTQSLWKNLALLAVLALPTFAQPITRHQTVTIDGLEIFYREAGLRNAPAILLLHGFPTSSLMYRNLIPALATKYRVVAPDYPGYGQSSMPSRDKFTYSFANYAQLMSKFTTAVGLTKYTLYVMDYGAPVGFRLALLHPERISGFIIQNGNAYTEGLREFWDPIKALWKDPSPANRNALRKLLTIEATKWQYTHGVPEPARISPEAWIVDQVGLDRAGNDEIQLDLFYDYWTNFDLYPAIQAYFRKYQPPTLIAWGKNDQIFPSQGATPYRRDLPKAKIHLLDAGHFVLETNGAEVAKLILDFLR